MSVLGSIGGFGHILTDPRAALIGEGQAPEAYVPLPEGRRIPVAMSSAASPIVRDALVQARAALRTAVSDTADDLRKPERASVLESKIALLTQALAALDGVAR